MSNRDSLPGKGPDAPQGQRPSDAPNRAQANRCNAPLLRTPGDGHTPHRLPIERADCHHVYRLYVVRVPTRERVRSYLTGAGIATAIHYPVPIHMQPAYSTHTRLPNPLLHNTEQAAGEILSLPMHPLLTAQQVEQVAAALHAALA